MVRYLRERFQWEKGKARIRREAAWNTSEFLQRSGFFNAVHEGRDLDEVWTAQLRDRVAQKEVERRELLLLDGCHFPERSFSVLDYTLVRFSKDEIDSLGPAPEVVKSFFPHEHLDRDWHSQYWFLCELSTAMFPSGEGRFLIPLGDPALEHWKPLLLLGLYRTECFSIPVIVESDWKWRMQRLRFSDTAVDPVEYRYGPGEDDVEFDELPMQPYEVTDADHFRAFLEFFKAPMTAVSRWSKNALIVAARRYLRATLLSDFCGDAPGFSDRDAHEDILLHYVYSLEALFSFGEGGFKDRLVTRGAWLAAGDDGERERIRDLLSKAYDTRSRLAHGAGSAQGIGLPQLRDIVRRILAVYLVLAGEFTSQKELQGFLGSVGFSVDVQQRVIETRSRVTPLLIP